MADNLVRLLAQMQGWAALLEANHEDAMRWIAEFLNGHPKAQDFEPTGHGGSDPTSVNGIRPDVAAQDGKDYEKHIRAAWRSLDAAVHISKRYQTAERPKRNPEDIDDVWCILHLRFDSHNPRYRGQLCRPCYEHQGRKRERNLGELTDDDIRYHAIHGKWPRHSSDPKVEPMRIAGLTRLQLGTEALPDPTGTDDD